MDNVLSSKVVDEILDLRLEATKNYQKCSFIRPDGKFLVMTEHYEAYKFLVVEGLVSCVPDAECLLSELGYIRFSWVGYMTLPYKKLTELQYKSIELALMNISETRYEISIQLQENPRDYMNYSLENIPYIIERIKFYYSSNKLLP